MDIVADLLAFIAVNLVFAVFEIALHQITEEAVQLDPGMVRAGQTTAAQTTGRQAEIPAILLHHDVASNFGSAEQRVLGLDRKSTRLNSSHANISYAVFC